MRANMRQFLLAPLLLITIVAMVQTSFPQLNSAVFAQDETETSEEDSTDSDDGTAGASTPITSTPTKKKKSKRTLFSMLFAGEFFGVLIVLLLMLLSLVSTFFVIEHFITINRSKLMPELTIAELEQRISRGEIDDAIEFCRLPDNYSLTSEVVLAGLERYRGTEFGFAEYKNAVEEAGEDQTNALYRKTEILGTIGAIAPMLGLTGTVLGMISAFNTLADTDGMAKPAELAGGIGQALITTLLGLVVAIPTMVAYSYFRNKIDSLVAEAGRRIERLMMPLGRKNR